MAGDIVAARRGREAQVALGLRLVAFVLCQRCAAGQECRLEQLDTTTGTITANSAHLQETCAWVLYPDRSNGYMQYDSITITDLGTQLPGDSELIFCVPMVFPEGGYLKCREYIKSYSSASPLPAEVTIKRDNYILMAFSRVEPGTAIDVSFVWNEVDAEISMWPIAALLILSLLGTCLSAALLYVVCFIRARLSSNRAFQGSHVTQFSQMEVQRREALEQRTLEALGNLPTSPWKEEEHSQGHAECCLCLEHYEREQSIRILPCHHYFHQSCIDHWFRTRRFMPRSCPLCKSNPVANVTAETTSSHPTGRVDASSSTTEAAGQGGAASPGRSSVAQEAAEPSADSELSSRPADRLSGEQPPHRIEEEELRQALQEELQQELVQEASESSNASSRRAPVAPHEPQATAYGQSVYSI